MLIFYLQKIAGHCLRASFKKNFGNPQKKISKLNAMLGCLLNLNRDRRNNDKLVSLFVAFFKGKVWVGVCRNNPLSSN